MGIGELTLFTLNSIMPVILLILLGYYLRKTGFLTAEFLKTGNKMVFHVCLPVLLFKNIAEIDSFSQIPWDAVVYLLVILVILFLVGAVLAAVIADPLQKGVIHQCLFRSNFALIGVPLAELMGGSEGVRCAAIFSLFTIPLFNVLAVVVLSVYRGGSAKISRKKIALDIAKNPLITGILLAFAVVLVKTLMPGSALVGLFERVTFPQTVITYLARSATPLALIVLGGQFDFKKIAGYRQQLIMGVAGRLVFAPLLGVGGAALLCRMGIFSFSPAVFAALISLFGTPVAVSSAIMAEAMDNDGQLAAQLVVWTSLISMLTLMVIVFLSKMAGLL